MMKFSRIALAVALAAALAACNQSSEPAPAASPAPEAAASPADTAAPATSDAAATGETIVDPRQEMEALAASSTGAPLGVPECDDYLTKYEACLADKVTDATTRDTLMKSMAATREAWRQAIASPGGQEQMAAACTQARDAARTGLAAYGCDL